jgi:hypothetical protein
MAQSRAIAMLPIRRRHSHVLYGVIQSGMTSGVASLIASLAFAGEAGFLVNWLRAWAIAFGLMLPVVLFAAPFIQKAVMRLTRE